MDINTALNVKIVFKAKEKKVGDFMKNNAEVVIRRVGEKYMTGSKPLRIKIGEILEGKIKLNYRGNKDNE